MKIFLIIIGFLATIGIMCVIAAWWGRKSNEKWMRSEGIDPNDPESFNNYLLEKRWKAQEEKDKLVLQDPSVKAKMETAFYTLQATYVSAEGFDEETKCQFYLDMLTPELFLNGYDAFKSKDWRKTKDFIYQERPYFTHDFYIKMGIHIFEVGQEINVLKHSIIAEEESLKPYVYEAQRRLNQEINDNSEEDD